VDCGPAPRQVRLTRLCPVPPQCDVRGKGERIVLADRGDKDALPALTEYRTVATTSQGFAWLEMKPLTGRKHQLRVHASYVLSCPIVGDYKYGYVGQIRKGKEKDGSVGVLDVEKKGRGKAVQKAGVAAIGDVKSASPRLHLHCRRVALPKLYRVCELGIGDEASRTAEILHIEAPLPPHMDASWKAFKFPDAP
jgi:23S rRNA-/tRNA-specific pseudouridylate synthase